MTDRWPAPEPLPGPGMGARLMAAVRSSAGLLAAIVVLLWVIEIVDTTVFDDQLQRNGIHPRDPTGLDGVVWAPFLHSTFGHVASNSIPFFVLGWLVALQGRRYWLVITIASALGGGLLVWLMAGGSNHLGASGVVFGYFGALMGGAIKTRRPAALAPALVAIFLYGTILVGIVPQDDISWEGHLFGLIVGGIVGWWLAAPPPPKPVDDPFDVQYPWELDEPWRTDHPDG